MAQETKKQHFVPEFYLARFADQGWIQVLDLKRRKIAKPRPCSGVCYKHYFYGLTTGVPDAVSQAFEEFFGALESQIAAALPDVIERALSSSLEYGHFDTLAYLMSAQWLRTESFRIRLQTMEAAAYKRVMQIAASHSSFPGMVRRIAIRQGKEFSEDLLGGVRRMAESPDSYELKVGNATHLRFITPDHVRGFHNLLLAKRWNVLMACDGSSFITADNPVAEWSPPRSGFYGASFLERKHYLSVTPKLLIETVAPPLDERRVDPSETVTYRSCSHDEVLMFNMLLASYANRYAYAGGVSALADLIDQQASPGVAAEMFLKNYR